MSEASVLLRIVRNGRWVEMDLLVMALVAMAVLLVKAGGSSRASFFSERSRVQLTHLPFCVAMLSNCRKMSEAEIDERFVVRGCFIVLVP